MKLRDIIGLIIALILAISVAIIVRIFFEKRSTSTPVTVSNVPQKQQVTKILVANKNLSEGELVKLGDLTWLEWPKTSLNPAYLTEDSANLENFTGFVVKIPLAQGEPIVRNAFIQQGDKSALSAVLEPGKRAVSIDVSSATANSGLINPGDFVDVILSFIGSKGNTQEAVESETLLKNIKVLAVDSDLLAPEGKITTPHVITLEVTPAQAEVLMSAVKKGTISLSLHSLAKDNATPLVEQAVKKKETEVATEKPKTDKVTIIRGSVTSIIDFQEFLPTNQAPAPENQALPPADQPLLKKIK